MRFMLVLLFECEFSLCNSVCGEPEKAWRKAELKARREKKFALNQFRVQIQHGLVRATSRYKKTA
jgi:hypothetical protein